MSERPPVEPDDLAPWVDDDLVRALRSPGTATELADQERYAAAYRDAGRSNVRSLPRRAVGRLGAGGTAVVVTVALTSGVAAAYTGHLPDPVQQIAHSVIGAPAPGRQHPEASGTPRGPAVTQSTPGSPSSTGPTTATSTGPSSTDTPSAGSSPTSGGHHGTGPTQGPGGSPGGSPTGAPTGGGSPPTTSGSAAAAMTMSAAAHRVGLGQTVNLTGLVTDATGAALPGHDVVLQVRGPRHWRPVASATTDDSGTATALTPPISRSARFRWHADKGVHSLPWLLKMVPNLTVSAEIGGSTTTITPAAQGSAPGDRVLLVRRVAGRTPLVRRARLDASGSAAIAVATPRRRATYVVRLLRTPRHAAVRARVVVVPPAPATVSIAGSASRVTPGTSVVIGGTVTSAAGDVLPGHQVVLLRRGPRHWRPVGHAVTDAAGHVSIATPPIAATSRFRLRTDHRARSVLWRVVETPTLGASAERDTSTVTITVTASGARAGDKVVLLRRVAGRLVRMRHAPLGGTGSLTFTVPARKTRTAYVVRLAGTKLHGPATASVVVAKAQGKRLHPGGPPGP
jgi:hypothetical protein